MAPAPKPEYKVGDEFVFSASVIEEVQKVTAVRADSITMDSSKVFGTITQSKAFMLPGSWTGGGFAGRLTVTPANNALDALFPLQVGNKASVQARVNYI